MKLEQVKDKIDDYFDNIDANEFFDVVTKKYNMPIIPMIIWVNDNEEFSNQYNPYPYDNSDYYNDIHSLRSHFSGQSYVYFPFKYDKKTFQFELVDIVKCGDITKQIPNFIDGYFIMNKRDIRTKDPKYRYIKTNEIKEIMFSEVKQYMEHLNEEEKFESRCL